MDEEMVNDSKSGLEQWERDAIGEILNISMGSSATAISSMLDRQVDISIPTVEMREFHSLDYSMMEPALMVKIQYVEGISGNNVMIFRQRDMQIILNLLMGNDDEPTDDFIFDELSMSAACEIMNQMMGAAATALSEFLGKVVNISTPVASIVNSENTYRSAIGVQEGDEVVAVSFQLVIEGVMNSNFVSIMTDNLVREMLSSAMNTQEENISTAIPEPTVPPAAPQQPVQQEAPGMGQQPVTQQPASGMGQQQPAMQQPAPGMGQQQPAMQQLAPGMGQQPMMQQPAPGMGQQQPMMQQPAPGMGQQEGMPPMQQPMMQPYGQPYGQMPPYGYPPQGYYPYGMPPYGQMPYGYPQEPQQAAFMRDVDVKNTQFPQFALRDTETPSTNFNMDLLMGVSLNVAVEIGQTKRKIKDILDFGQGTIIELDKQAGSLVDIVVNGKLLARGDVVVIDDNFGVRITEIVGTRELMESLKENMQ